MEMEKEVKILNLDDILPNRFQPRIQFNESAILELAESIKEHGVIQPIVVRKIGDKYEIIAGERRYKASVLAGKTTIPAIITSLNDKDSAEVALIENVQRENLTPIEEAISYKKILDMGYLNQVTLADKLGKTQSTIANKIRLLNLAEEVQEALLNNKISERHARSLLKLNEKDQIDMLHRIVNERLTVRKTDEEINKILAGNTEEAASTSEEVTIIPVEQESTSTEEILSLTEEEKESKTIMPEEIKMPMDPIIEPIVQNNPVGMNESVNSLWNTAPIPVEEIKKEMNTSEVTPVNTNEDIPTMNINPGFMDVEKIENEAEDIFKPEPIKADIDMLLNPTEMPEMPVAESPMAPATPAELEPSKPVEEAPQNPGKFFNMFNFSDMGNTTPSNSDLEQQETNMEFTQPKVSDTFMFNFNPLENTTPVVEEPQSINSAETYDDVATFNPTPVVEDVSMSASTNVETNVPQSIESNLPTFNTNDSMTSPISVSNVPEEESQPTTFAPFEPYTLTDDEEFTKVPTAFAEETIDANDSIAFVNPVSSIQDASPSPSFNVREVVKELRICNDRLQQLGYEVDLEELDLENIYQATFKITKSNNE